MHSDRDVGAGIMYLYGRWNDTNFPPTDSFRGKTSSSSSSSLHSTHLFSCPSTSFFCSKMSFLTHIFFGGAHMSQSTVYLEVSTYLLQTLVYNLQLPCVHPLTSLCTTSNFLVFFPSSVSVYIICFWLFPCIPSFLEVMIHDK